MMSQKPDLSSGWSTFEVIHKDAKGEYAVTPFSGALASSGTMPTQAITKMKMVQSLGWPEARRKLKDDQGRPIIVKKDSIVWLLKCKPSCWRLYFYVSEKEKRITYLHAVCKQQNAEDPSDAAKARSAYDGIQERGSGITAFEFPVG